MTEPVHEFQEMLILKQGLIESFTFDLPKISVHFNFPKRFEVHFNKAVDYRAKLPLSFRTTIKKWSASRDSEFLSALPERRLRHRLPPLDDLDQLCHFHITLHNGYLDVLADDFVFMMVSR